ncbi:single-stranded nucleic acid binding protein R3H domain-containing protein [Trypanosoma grayi]|uniref:single-stranded nucleic acid binding protein R3H domain-containing protein n=1 Tax=Trypanosoma grayi TaxID=71804 RepID=UPI0004F40E5D|nr:single-stranded nucleic acid binding protein R3H domain-containing protein [Trypanosoma grayi]KEG14640.1 single-stranded nucleic acid binding protein R3H domain-containing protein [Trypanosoma grayi]
MRFLLQLPLPVVLRPAGAAYFRSDCLSYSKRCIRLRHRNVGPASLHLTDEGLLAASSQRSPPMGMPLTYLQQYIADVEQYQNDTSTWSNDTLRDAWKAFHHSLETAMKMEDGLKAQQLIVKDQVGLALCTSYAEVKYLLSMLAPSLRSAIVSHSSFVHAEVEEFFIHLGQEMEVRGGEWVIQLPPPSVSELQFTIEKVGRFGDDGRGCIRNTPHRVSVWRGRLGEPLGLTIRVGRYVPNIAKALVPLVHRGSVLILSKAGMGKTTLLRDLAASLSREASKPRVIVVDTSNEIGGDSPIPLPFLGRCRRMQVPRREEQQQVLTQILQNHSPEYVIVDEIATASEAEAAWSISQRGVHLIATCHGESLAGLLQNQSLNLLVGGAAQAFLSNEERRLRNKSKKTILERPHSSPFQFVVELHSRSSAHIYVDVNTAVDLILDDQDATKNASVGRVVSIDRAPSEELMGVLIAKEKKAELDANRRALVQREKIEEETGEDRCGDEGVAEGCQPKRPWVDKRRRKHHGGKKKTDEELLDDLNSFF